MGFEYALVHLKYTIPPAIALTFVYRPLLTRLDVYKIFFLITIAVISTIPWDSYLIRANIWSYPAEVIIGPKIFGIPLEELFFFVIQTYNTTLLYLLLSKPTFHPIYLRYEEKKDKWRYYRTAGQLLLAMVMKRGVTMVRENDKGTYLGLILVWAVPFTLLLWSLSYQFLIGLPLTNTALPIILPTLYLWIVDTLALRRGTWIIESGTKFGTHLWPNLEIEEAVFFLMTNIMIVFGLVAFDNAVAVLDAFPFHFPNAPALPSPYLLVKALMLPASAYDGDRLNGFKQAVDRLHRKSRSFYLASAAFPGRLRIDMIILYSFCRVADDLVDNASTPKEARQWIKRLQTFLDLSYKSNDNLARDANVGIIAHYVTQNFPRNTHLALIQLPTDRLPRQPLYDLLKGFEMDLHFLMPQTETAGQARFPIKSESDLDLYSSRVAGTVALLCLELVFHYFPGKVPTIARQRLVSAGEDMGVALQYINIARDLTTDALAQRIYVPATWLKEEKLTPDQALKVLVVLQTKTGANEHDAIFAGKIERLRSRLLDRGFAYYEASRKAIDDLPVQVRGPMRVAVESYMEIGRTLRQPGYAVKQGRATVSLGRRAIVAWRALSRG